MEVEANKIKTELAKVGISVNDIYDLVNTDKSYPAAVPVLLNLLQEGIEHIGIKEGIIRALAVKEAIGKASPILVAEYNRTPKDKMPLRWAIGNTIYITITKNDVESILPIIQDKTNGMSRQMFVAALGKVESEKAEDVLISLLDDEEVTPHALEALGRMNSKKAKDKISMLTRHHKALIRKEAKKALKEIL
jgi:HEAT repeat protein